MINLESTDRNDLELYAKSSKLELTSRVMQRTAACATGSVMYGALCAYAYPPFLRETWRNIRSCDHETTIFSSANLVSEISGLVGYGAVFALHACMLASDRYSPASYSIVASNFIAANAIRAFGNK